jgi:hypothetical protein
MSRLERVTVNLIPRASDSLREGMELTGHSKTDYINRAIQVYEYIADVMSNGGAVLIREPGEDQMSQIKFL